eukprot:GHRR01027837.1.p1 GENE.GHRR01027837.1~~GHRR01027837.1.p1  ORF type:complete len:184 (-),score=53.04 GHRR01027837.1:485-1036(-)
MLLQLYQERCAVYLLAVAARLVRIYKSDRGRVLVFACAAASGLANGLKHPTTGDPVVLDIIGFDACLMAMYEVATSLAPFARHLLVSELLEPGHGWDYARPIGSITQQMDVTSQAVASLSSLDVARLAIQGYFDQVCRLDVGVRLLQLHSGLLVHPLAEIAAFKGSLYVAVELQLTITAMLAA